MSFPTLRGKGCCPTEGTFVEGGLGFGAKDVETSNPHFCLCLALGKVWVDPALPWPIFQQVRNRDTCVGRAGLYEDARHREIRAILFYSRVQSSYLYCVTY